jgi:hypothetical protein
MRTRSRGRHGGADAVAGVDERAVLGMGEAVLARALVFDVGQEVVAVVDQLVARDLVGAGRAPLQRDGGRVVEREGRHDQLAQERRDVGDARDVGLGRLHGRVVRVDGGRKRRRHRRPDLFLEGLRGGATSATYASRRWAAGVPAAQRNASTRAFTEPSTARRLALRNAAASGVLPVPVPATASSKRARVGGRLPGRLDPLVAVVARAAEVAGAGVRRPRSVHAGAEDGQRVVLGQVRLGHQHVQRDGRPRRRRS